MIRRNQYVSVHETRAQVTREKLLKAAIKLVNRDGMKQLTVRNICDEAGLSTGEFLQPVQRQGGSYLLLLEVRFRTLSRKGS